MEISEIEFSATTKTRNRRNKPKQKEMVSPKLFLKCKTENNKMATELFANSNSKKIVARSA